MNDINLNPALVNTTLATLARPHPNITTVTVVRQINGPPATPAKGTYTLIPSTTTPGPLTRWPVVLTLEQERAGYFTPDWSRILLFVIPHPRDYHGNNQSNSDAQAVMCVHPFGM
jgi:hypothetical protein